MDSPARGRLRRHPLAAALSLCLATYAVVFFLPGGDDAENDSGLEAGLATAPESTTAAQASAAAEIQQSPPAVVASPTTGNAVVLARGDDLHPYALAVSAGADLVVADARNHRVVVFSKSGRKLDSFGEEGSGLGEFDSIEDIAIGSDGRIYVLESRPGRVQRLRSDGTPEAVVAQGEWCAPNGLDVDEGGRLYIAETCGSRILQLSATGVLERAFSGGSDAATRLEQPLDVVVGEAGDLYVADLRARLVRIDMESDRIEASWPVSVGGAGSAIAVHGALLYLSDPDRHVIHRVDTTSGAVASLGRPGEPGEFTTPSGIAVGREGELYVGDATGTVLVLSAEGFDPRD